MPAGEAVIVAVACSQLLRSFGTASAPIMLDKALESGLRMLFPSEANLWAVVWENSKPAPPDRPGPSVKDGWARQNFMVVDTSLQFALKLTCGGLLHVGDPACELPEPDMKVGASAFHPPVAIPSQILRLNEVRRLAAHSAPRAAMPCWVDLRSRTVALSAALDLASQPRDLMYRISMHGMTHGRNDSQALEALPFLSVGDVVRVGAQGPPCAHQLEAAAPGAYTPFRKFAGYINIRQQSPGPLSRRAHERVLDRKSLESQLVQSPVRPIGGEKHTVVESDFARARSLQAWIQRRLKQETMSGYLVTARELLGRGGHRDLVVQVLEVDTHTRRLLVSDGSTDSLRVETRSVHTPGCVYKERPEQMTVRQPEGRAAVTRVPEWCMDVETRRKGMEGSAAVLILPYGSAGNGPPTTS
ncbi:hypothetical protein AK812_SmicGene30221 [Symbiodinium microadriaticum]|uniref:Uncharacterized protein n=1 Tax=Symbiodinium microadriaticum TaxID=2951 RepID=A0A1Q9CZV2_SYMMI|nr:hypothetical protein AK812_SmicGene30221 [Symbiodinium microadriaticum]